MRPCVRGTLVLAATGLATADLINALLVALLWSNHLMLLLKLAASTAPCSLYFLAEHVENAAGKCNNADVENVFDEMRPARFPLLC